MEPDTPSSTGRAPGLINTSTTTTARRVARSPKSRAIDAIEGVFENIVDSLTDNDTKLTILLKRRDPSAFLRRASNADADADAVIEKEITFPGRTPQEAWRFTITVRILELMHEAITNGMITTKRDIYYKDPALFVKQSVVDRYVDDIAFTFNVPRSALSVAAAAKGLFAGVVLVKKQDGQYHDGRQTQEGLLVPDLTDADTIEADQARWVLVIEKEAVFHSLLTSDCWPDLCEQGIIVTGKGYPDLATRGLCYRLSSLTLHGSDRRLPLYALVDWDPDGIGILSTYKHGSAVLQRHDNPLLPGIHWLGLRSTHLTDANAGNDLRSLLALTDRDRRKASKMLEWDHVGGVDGERSWRRELQLMLMLGYKAEIQALDETTRGVSEWVRQRLVEG